MAEQPNLESVIVVEDETLQAGFTQIPNAILRRPDLSPGAKLAYMALLSYSWQRGSCYPGQETLAKDIGAGKRSVIRYLQELQDADMLRVRRRGLGQTNVYFLPKGSGTSGNAKLALQQDDSPRSAKTALQEVPETTYQEVPNLHLEEDSIEKETGEEDTDHSNIRKVRTSLGKGRRSGQSTPPSSGAHPNDQTDNGIASVGDLIAARFGRASAGQGSEPSTSSDQPTQPAKRNVTHEEELMLSGMVEVLRREMNDAAPLKSSVTRLRNLYLRAGLGPGSFIERIDEARRLTLTYTPSIQKQAQDNGSGFRRKNKMAYFYEVLEDKLRIKPTEAAKSAVGRR